MDTLVVTEPDFRKAMPAEALTELVQTIREQLGYSFELIVEPNWKQALTRLQTLTSDADLAVVTGTLYLIADVRSTYCFTIWILKKVGEPSLNTAEHVHFIGIGGYGMSAIARVMLEMGYKVTGSDVARQEFTEKLAAKGAHIYIGHEPEHVEGAIWLSIPPHCLETMWNDSGRGAQYSDSTSCTNACKTNE